MDGADEKSVFNVLIKCLLLLNFTAETMQRNCEASLKCLQSQGVPYNLKCNGNSVDGFTKPKDEISTHQGGNVEPDRSLGSEFPEPPNDFYNKTTYQHDFSTWSTFHFDSQKVQQCQINAFESQLYPFPVENRFQYVPFNMVAQGHPYDFQFQDFQYFVVIDFEATCEKDRTPNPQEIIEFPSVIVNSVTGQLEACFQTYVRPTCNQLLSDFCKGLTGIQQIQVCSELSLPIFIERKC
jgi:ERI1 exoribonuclease 2